MSNILRREIRDLIDAVFNTLRRTVGHSTADPVTELSLDSLIDHYTAVIRLNPRDASALNSRGIAYGIKGEVEAAITDFTAVIRLNPEYDDAFYNRGHCYLQTKQYQAALRDLRQAIEYYADDWYYYVRGLTYRLLNQPAEAQTDFQEAISLAQQSLETDPQDWQTHFNLALYTLVVGEAAQAEQLYQQGLAADVLLDRLKEAHGDLIEFLELFPGHPQAQAMRDLLQPHLEA